MTKGRTVKKSVKGLLTDFCSSMIKLAEAEHRKTAACVKSNLLYLLGNLYVRIHKSWNSMNGYLTDLVQ